MPGSRSPVEVIEILHSVTRLSERPLARGRQAARLAVGLLVAGPFLALFHDALGNNRSFFLMDLRSFYRPAKSLLVPLLRTSEGLPSWNPFFAHGQPFAANPHHAFWHPMTALFFVLPFELAFRLQVLLPPLVAFFGMLFLLRSLRLGWLAALLGATSWAYGGYLLSTTRLLPLLLSVWALPYALGFAARLARGGGPGVVAGLGLSLGITLLAGEPATLLALPLLFAATLLQERELGGGVLATRLSAAAVLALLVGSAALLPGLAFAAKTSRAAGVPEAHAFGWSMPFSRLAELLAPFSFTARAEQYPYFEAPFIASLYPGLLITLAVPFALRRRRAWGWLATAALFSLLALGGHTPLWGWLRSSLGLFAGIRYPERFAMPLAFAAVVLGAQGFQELVGNRALCRRAAVWACSALLIGAALLLAPRDGALRLVTISAVIAALLWLGCGRARRPALLALLCVNAADLALAGRRLVPTAPLSDVTSPPAALRPLLGAGPNKRLFHLAEYRVPVLRQPEVAAPPIPAQWGIATALSRDYDLTELKWSAQATWAVSELLKTRPALAGPLLARRGIDCVLRLGGDGRTLQLVHDDRTTGLAFLAQRVDGAADAASWIGRVEALGEASRTTAILATPRTAALPQEPSNGSVRVTRPRANVLELSADVTGPQPGLLAINETWDDGWEARIDGRPAPLLRTDLSLMAIAVPPGSHAVRLRHRDPRLAWGLALSCVGVLLCAGIAARERSPQASPKTSD